VEQSSVEKTSAEHSVQGSSEPRMPAMGLTASGPRQEAYEEASGHAADLMAKVRSLEAELTRYREHAQRTSKLFLSASNFAEWVRESARRDAEVTLRKARARAERLGALEEECERAEHELAQLRDELTRMRALTDEARARLSGFLAAGLQALNAEDGAGGARVEGTEFEPHGALQATLHERVGVTSTSLRDSGAEPVRPDLQPWLPSSTPNE
jgi:cell division septum initiation protein DivIVA